VQTFAQIVRLAFFGAAGDPSRIIPSAAIAAVSLLFAGIFWCLWVSSKGASLLNDNSRIFYRSFMVGYLLSIPFFYKDGGLRLHAAVLPVLSYMIACLLQPADAAGEGSNSLAGAGRFLTAATAFGFLLLGLLGWISTMHPKGGNFNLASAAVSAPENEVVFRFMPGWPRCDLGKFERRQNDDSPRWFSGAIPDDDYRSAGIRQISGQGYLYFGFDAGALQWKIMHTDQPIGELSMIAVRPLSHEMYRDFYSADSVQIIGAAARPVP
jgi:hypothetical protein